MIGRWFDARTWWALAARRDPSVADEARAAIDRLAAKDQATRSTDGGTLADLLGRPGRRKPTDSGPHDLVIPTFVDEAAARGLVSASTTAPAREHQLPETMPGGVAVLDFDGDGLARRLRPPGRPSLRRAAPSPFGDRLFRNRGDGCFQDVTATLAWPRCRRLRSRRRRGRLRQ